jgi:hypothetical protein
MRFYELLDRYLGLSKRGVASLYRWTAIGGFSLGLSLVVVAVIVPDAGAVLLRYLLPDSSFSLAEDLRVSFRFLMFLYGTLTSSLAVAFYLFTQGFVHAHTTEDVSTHKVGLRFVVFVSFVVGFIGARAVVVAAGLVGDDTSSGTFLGLPIHQLDFGAIHIHHYFYGFVTLAVVGWIAVFRDDYSKTTVGVLYGLGMGVFLDEIGMLLTGGKYYARSTYFAAVLFISVFFAALYWDLKKKEKQE